jgi:hypothetical protein
MVVMGSKPRPSRYVPSHLVVKLKTGWRYDASARAFTCTRGGSAPVKPDLPRRSRIEYMVPHLADADVGSLNADERDLAHYVHLLFSKGTDARKYVDVVSAWKCVEAVEVPPEVGLPD